MEITRAPRRGKNIERNFSSVSPQLSPKNRALTLLLRRCQSRDL
jgi:hypothetical protein